MANTKIRFDRVEDFSKSSGDRVIKNTVEDKDIILKVNDGGVDTEVMRLDGGTSRVGIGTASPSRPLDIRSDTGFQLGAGEDVDHYLSSDNYYIDNVTSNKDVIIRANDGGTMRTAIQVNGDEGSVSFPRQSAFRASRPGGGQTIAHNTYTKVVLSNETLDVLGEFDNVTNYRFTAKDAGMYLINAGVVWTNTNAGNSYRFTLYKNGSINYDSYYWLNAGATNASELPQNMTQLYSLNAGDYLELYAYQTSGGNEDIGEHGRCFLSGVKVA
jgi:hypothetical protein